MGSITWGPQIAEVYDKTYAAGFEPSVLGPLVGVLAKLSRGGPALEFAVGTGSATSTAAGGATSLG
jgi:hypothetical protein